MTTMRPNDGGVTLTVEPSDTPTEIYVGVGRINGQKVGVGIDAPPEVRIRRNPKPATYETAPGSLKEGCS